MSKNEKETIMQGQKTQFRRLKLLETSEMRALLGWSIEMLSIP